MRDRTRTLGDGIRRSDRVPIFIPIEAIGMDLVRGRPFRVRGKTILVSRHGAAITLSYALATDQEMTIRCPDLNTEAEARVVGLIDAESKELIYGVAFLDPASNPWNIHFPALTDSEEVLARILMLCSSCQTLEVMHLDEIELQVFQANGRIQRFCKSCLATTAWKHMVEDTVCPRVLSPDKAIPHKVIQPTPREKRKHNRIKTSISACIRQLGFPDEIVVCENLSRGGIRFISSRLYATDSRIEVAVPFLSQGVNIFVPSHIVHVQEYEGSFKIGAAYIQTRGRKGSSKHTKAQLLR